MAENTDIVVRIKAEGAEQFIKSLKEAGIKVDEVGTKTEKAGKKVDKSTDKMGSQFKKLAGLVGAAFATQRIIEFTKGLARLAVDLDATEKKFKTVFGEASGIVERFAKKNATSLGLTTSEYKKAAAAAGDLLIPLGFQREEAAKLSSGLVNLSGALSAWSGGQVDAKGVADILTKALLGEREQLKTLGIQISEADIKQRLLDKGQQKLTGSTLAQAKANATLELIIEKSKDAQTAFADQTKTLAEQSLILNANIKEVRDSLANALVPILTTTTTKVINLIQGYKDLRQALNDLTARGGKEEADSFRLISDALFDYGDATEDYLKKEQERLSQIRLTLDATRAQEQQQDRDKASLEVINALLQTQGFTLEQVREELNKLDPSIEGNTALIQVLTKKWRDFNKTGGEGGGEDTSIGIIKGLKEKLKELNEQLTNATTVEEIGKVQDAIKDTKLELQSTLLAAVALKRALEELDSDDDPFDAKQQKEFNDETNKTKALLDDIERKKLEAKNAEESTLLEEEKAFQNELDNIGDGFETWYDAEIRKREEAEKTLEEQKKLAEQEKKFREQTIIQTARLSFDTFQKLNQAEQQILENKLNQGLISEKEYQQEKAELQTKAAKTAKAQSIFEIGLNTAVAITSALKAGPIIGPILGAVIAGLATAQLAAVVKTPIPKFRKGTRQVGDGYEMGEDRTLAWLNKGERVVTADTNRKNFKLFNAIEDGDINQMMKELAGMGLAVQFSTGSLLMDQLDTPMKTLKEIRGDNNKKGLDLNPLLNASDRQRYTLGKKLDKIHSAIVSNNHRMTRA